MMMTMKTWSKNNQEKQEQKIGQDVFTLGGINQL